MQIHKLVDAKTLSKLWLVSTEIHTSLSEIVMQSMKVIKVVRMDHSQKFCKHLKSFSANGAKEGVKEIRMLLLLQNEIGQIVASRLTSSENNTETVIVLAEALKSRIDASDPENQLFLVSDNANGVRCMRISDNLKSKNEKVQLSKALSAALYTPAEEFWPPAEMEKRLRDSVCHADANDLSCSEKEWLGCIESNVKQIRGGDMAIESNIHNEGGSDIKVISTSQLEGFHACLKYLINRSVSVRMGMRILDIFILQVIENIFAAVEVLCYGFVMQMTDLCTLCDQHNLSIGSKFDRNPHFGATDFVQLCQTAAHCNGVLPDSPQLNYALEILSFEVNDPNYRANSANDFPFTRWLRLFNATQHNKGYLEERLHERRSHQSDIRALLMQNARHITVSRYISRDIFEALNTVEAEVESSRDLSFHEFELIRQIRSEQMQCGRSWATSVIVTTILFNLMATQNEFDRSKIKRRSYNTIQQKIISSKAPDPPQNERTSTASLFVFRPGRLDDDHDTSEGHTTPEEEEEERVLLAVRLCVMRLQRDQSEERGSAETQMGNIVKTSARTNPNLKFVIRLPTSMMELAVPATAMKPMVCPVSDLVRQEIEAPAHKGADSTQAPPCPNVAPDVTTQAPTEKAHPNATVVVQTAQIRMRTHEDISEPHMIILHNAFR